MKQALVVAFIILYLGLIFAWRSRYIRLRQSWPFFSLFTNRLNVSQKVILFKYSDYYIRLKPHYKKEFEKRVAHFIWNKQFLARQMSSVTEEMQVLIASVAIQLTFGLPKVYLSHFTKILVYPTAYYSTINKTYHKGEVNPRFGLIVLSWDAFVAGMRKRTDGLSLGLHEFAHALHLENRIKNSEYGYFNAQVWDAYLYQSHKERITIEIGTNPFFRKYASIDEYEFFAVAVELFFEQSQALNDYNTILYITLTRLLGQNPLKILK